MNHGHIKTVRIHPLFFSAAFGDSMADTTLLRLERYVVLSPEKLPKGPVTVKLDFVYDGGGLGKGGKTTLYINDKAVATEM